MACDMEMDLVCFYIHSFHKHTQSINELQVAYENVGCQFSPVRYRQCVLNLNHAGIKMII